MFLPAWVFALTLNSVTPSVINSSEDVVTISASASGLTGTSPRYLQAVFTKEGESSNYLGFTKNLNDEWYVYKSSPATSDFAYFYTFNTVGGTWSGQLSAKIDTSDDGFKGPGTYLLKLYRYLSSSGTLSDNSVPITVNVSAPTATTEIQTQTTVSETIVKPSVTWNLPEKAIGGEPFKVSVEIKDFDKDTDYFIKVRGAQTKNGSAYLSDNEAWVKFPLIKTNNSGSWSGDVYGLFVLEKSEGKYSVKIRVRKKDSDSFYETDAKEITLEKPLNEEVKTPTASSVSGWKPLVLGTKSATVKQSTQSSSPVLVVPNTTNPWLFAMGSLGIFFIIGAIWGLIKDRFPTKKAL